MTTGQRVVRVLPDVPAIDRAFDYAVPEPFADRVGVGSVVRVPLHGRRVRGWVLEVDVEPPAGIRLLPLSGVTGHGPAPELAELARWAAWRWSGRLAQFLGTASPSTAVRGLPPPRRNRYSVAVAGDELTALTTEALALPGPVLRVPPAVAVGPLVATVAVTCGTTVVVAPTHADAERLGRALRSIGLQVANLPHGWAAAAAGVDVIVGARAAVWAPAEGLGAIVVVDEHDEAHGSEATPTWHAREVAVERARRAGVPCLLISPCPSQESLAGSRLVVGSRSFERAGWPAVDVVDRGLEDPIRVDLFSPRLLDAIAGGGRVIGVLNRTGRVRLLACGACGELARCEVCEAAVGTGEHDQLVCARCSTTRPQICLRCGSGRLRSRRLGISRVREDLERLVGEPVVEVSGRSKPDADSDQALRRARVVVGTEAVLHRVDHADVVAFLDFDAELLAPRVRAAEEALGLLARAARITGGRRDGGRLILQTRLPRHEVVQAAVLADPARVADVESRRRHDLSLPPVSAVALVSGDAAAVFVGALVGRPGIEVLGPSDGAWLVRAPDHGVLCDALAATPRPEQGRLRVAVDPLRF